MSGTDERRPAHDGDDRMAEYLAGALPAEDALALEREVLSDDAQAEAMYGDVNVSAAIGAASGRRGNVIGIPWWRRGGVRIAVPLAAAALAALVLLPSRERTGPGEATFRGEGARLLAPVGELDELPSRFTWTPDPGAAMYRLELHDLDTRLRYRVTTTDTTVALPAEAFAGTPFEAGYWKVVPMNEAGVERPGPPPASIRVRTTR